MIRKSIVSLAVPAGTLLVTVLLGVPALILASNSADFHASLTMVSGILLLTAIAALSVIAGVGSVVPARVNRAVSVALYGLAAFAWVRASFFPGPSILLDGREASIRIETGLLAHLVPLLFGTLAGLLALRRERIAVRFFSFLLAGILLQAAYQLASVFDDSDDDAAPDSRAIAEMSTESNVLIILLDAFQSDLFEDILREQPDTSAQFEGFVYFPDTLSAAPTTYISLPSIHAGSMTATSGMTLEEQFSLAIVDRSFLNSFADQGYVTNYLRSAGECPSRIGSCLSASVFASGGASAAIAEARILASIGVYRIAPDPIREQIAASWGATPGGTRANDPLLNQIMSGVYSLQRYSSEMGVRDGTPRVTFLHSLATHAPFILDRNCEHQPEKYDREAALAQASCAVSALISVLRRMRELGIYDNSLVVVLADHGHGVGSSRVTGGEGSNALRSLVGSVNPLLLVKEPHSSAPLEVSRAQVSLGDIAHAMCPERNCDPAGFHARLAGAGEARARALTNYEWKHEYWHLPEIPGAVDFQVDGSLFDLRSWTAVGIPSAVGKSLRFNAGGNGIRNAGFGWSNPQVAGMWSDGAYASLFVGAADDAKVPYVLTVHGRLYGASAATPRTVRVYLNGALVGELTSVDAQVDIGTEPIHIPAGMMRSSNGNQILFEIVEPLNPPGPDERLLGIALERVIVEPSINKAPGKSSGKAGARTASESPEVMSR